MSTPGGENELERESKRQRTEAPDRREHLEV